ncbi:T9SS type A sorting domain-containing protein [Flavobacterium koreense]
MKKIITLLVLLILNGAEAQSWQWGKRLGSDDSVPITGEFIVSLQIDSNRNTYVLAKVATTNIDVNGTSLPSYGGDNDFVLTSFSCDGTYRWATVIGGYGADDCLDMRIDGNGDVYVLISPVYGGQFDEVFHFDATTIIPYSFENRKKLYLAKYNGLTGNVIWYQSPQPDGWTEQQYNSGLKALHVDADGTSYMLCVVKPGVYGGIYTSTQSPTSYVIFKYSSGGVVLQAIPIVMDVTSNNSRGREITLRKGSNNQLYISGHITNSTYPLSFNGQLITGIIYVAAFSDTGQFLWVKSTDSKTLGGRVPDFCIDNQDNIYITGSAGGGQTFLGYSINGNNGVTGRPYCFKLNSNGDLLWGSHATEVGGQTPSNGITFSDNEVVVAPTIFSGITWGSMNFPLVMNNGSDAGILRLNKATGSVLGYSIPQVTNGISESGSYVVADSSNNYYLSGTFTGNYTINGNTLVNDGSGVDMFIAKYGAATCNLDTPENNTQSTVLYPNPAQGKVNVSVTSKTKYTIFNVLGSKVSDGVIDEVNNEINTQSLAIGNYTFFLQKDDGTSQTIKFMKR